MKDIQKTIDMINELLPYSIGISVSYPLPGTIFYEKVKNDLQQKTNWTDSDELQMMFSNTFRPAFYKQLHRYVHRNYRTHLAIDQARSLFTKPGSVNIAGLKKVLSVFYYAPAAFFARWKMNLKKSEPV
jgi:anaerobic magnesium-protoporphyrin IX monomethyl ester cyclase